MECHCSDYSSGTHIRQIQKFMRHQLAGNYFKFDLILIFFNFKIFNFLIFKFLIF